jgi:hypothetical protein
MYARPMGSGMSMRIAVIIAFTLAACGGGGTPQKTPDAAADAFQSNCGFPGDPGNEIGVGKFCAQLSDCNGNGSATLCSDLGDPSTHFCTKTCAMGSTDQCGSNATCTCNSSNQCGCTPNTCLN